MCDGPYQNEQFLWRKPELQNTSFTDAGCLGSSRTRISIHNFNNIKDILRKFLSDQLSLAGIIIMTFQEVHCDSESDTVCIISYSVNYGMSISVLFGREWHYFQHVIGCHRVSEKSKLFYLKYRYKTFIFVLKLSTKVRVRLGVRQPEMLTE